MFMSWSLRDTCSELHAWFISPLFTWDRKTQWDMGFSAAINNMVNFTSPVSNKSEPQGFSVNMKPHFIFSLILLFWLSQILVPPSYRIWGYKNIPSFWRLARLSAAVKGPRHFTLQRYQRTKQETKASRVCRSHLMRWTKTSAWNCAGFDKGCCCPFHITTQYGSDSHVILESQRWVRKSALKGKEEREKLSLDCLLQAKMKNLRSPGSHKH